MLRYFRTTISRSSATEDELTKFVIIGMGYIALEMAESLRALNLDVAMVKPRPVFLPWMPEKMNHVILDELHAEGVRTYAGQGITAIEENDGGESRLRVVCDEETLDADMGPNADHRQPAAEKALNSPKSSANWRRYASSLVL